jgi:hypothetical protein
MARAAGLVFVGSTRGLFSRRSIKKFKEQEGFARDVMVIGSTGFRTFVDPKGDLHNVMKHCREAKIMFLNPYSEGANARARSIVDPDITLESFREQIIKSIDFMKGLKAVQKNVRLKLYQDIPLLKLVILGDYIWIKHYHAGLDVRMMPEYVFKHDKNTGSLHIPFYHYFRPSGMTWVPSATRAKLVYRMNRNEVRGKIRRWRRTLFRPPIVESSGQGTPCVAEDREQYPCSRRSSGSRQVSGPSRRAF